MDLKEALLHAELYRRYLERPDVKFGASFTVILEAAKRELQRQEAERPKRASLGNLEDALRTSAPWVEVQGKPYHERCLVEAADILKALREKVVPALLRDVAADDSWKHQALYCLRALGEEP